ncbi:Imm48 family immunity protein [Paenibacillus tyrfis]|uniref:Imm48 family immunity protein n=1 Tax=Paenibacillus tyrfis TaxID=1501230 RepID=UPI000B5933CD|nr:Imm48 family immunity protein [Paenibacillus tyrfis]
MEQLTEITEFADRLFDLIEIPFTETTELERQLIAAFSFGAVMAVAVRDDLDQPQTHALTIAMLMRAFQYSEHQAAAFAHDLIQATDRNHHPTMNAIIHRGINGHYEYVNEEMEDLRQNLLDILNSFSE